MIVTILLPDPAIKTHVRRLLSPGQEICEVDSATNISNCPRVGGEKHTTRVTTSSSNYDKKKGRKQQDSPELPVGSPQAPTGANQYATRSNGSYSDASGSSEFEALLPPTDSFKEEERAQWEPLSGEKFSRQKNTPR